MMGADGRTDGGKMDGRTDGRTLKIFGGSNIISATFCAEG